MATAFRVTCQGRTKPLADWLDVAPAADDEQVNVRDLVNAAGAPEHPTFPAYWTRASRPQAVRDALRWIAGRSKQQAVRAGLPFWGANLLDDAERDERHAALAAAKEFVESLQAFSSPGKLKNFPVRRRRRGAPGAGTGRAPRHGDAPRR